MKVKVTDIFLCLISTSQFNIEVEFFKRLTYIAVTYFFLESHASNTFLMNTFNAKEFLLRITFDAMSSALSVSSLAAAKAKAATGGETLNKKKYLKLNLRQ